MCASVIKQYNLVQAKGQWCSSTGKVTAGLVESNDSIPPGWLINWLIDWLTDWLIDWLIDWSLLKHVTNVHATNRTTVTMNQSPAGWLPRDRDLIRAQLIEYPLPSVIVILAVSDTLVTIRWVMVLASKKVSYTVVQLQQKILIFTPLMRSRIRGISSEFSILSTYNAFSEVGLRCSSA